MVPGSLNKSRPDRDDYVTINWENIDLGVRFNFLKFGGEAWTTNNQPYNYMSVTGLSYPITLG